MSLYRKYRPQFFRDVMGQEAIVTTLKNGLKEGKIGSAYLFCGCRGTGKTTLARLLAKALNCEHPQNGEPCGTCLSCQEIALGKSLDVIEIDGASNRGIEDIRKINETVSYAPSCGQFKIYIIDEVHMLTKEAFNALLKTLEEPPAHVKFFFATTEPHKVLPTIISRCQRFDLNRISFAAMLLKLKEIASDQKISYEEEALETLIQLSEGSLRDAESLLEQVMSYDSFLSKKTLEQVLRLVPQTLFFDLDRAIQEQNYPFAFELSSFLFSAGKDLNHFLTTLIAHFRLHLHAQYHLALPSVSAEIQEYYAKTSSLYTEEQCLCILDYLIEWEQKIRHVSLNPMTLEMIFLYLMRSKYRISLVQLTKRLIALEQQLKKASPVPEPLPIQEPSPALASEEKKSVVQELGVHKEPLKTKENPLSKEEQTRHDTLIRFAAVELEGTIKK